MLTLILIYNFVLLGLVLILLLIAWRAHRWRLLVGAGAGTALIALALLLAVYLGGLTFVAMHFFAYGLFLHGTLFALGLAAILWRTQRKSAVAALTAAAALVAVAVDAFLVEPNWLDVTHVRLTSEKVTRPYRIVLVADLQTDRLGAHERRAFEEIVRAKPDLVVMAGDYLQVESQDAVGLFMEFNRYLRDLRFSAPLGVYAVGGNTDQPGWEVLFHGTEVVTIKETRSCQVGELLLTGLSVPDSFNTQLAIRKSDRYQIVVGHAPDYALGRAEADLLLAGHTHGGQVQLPLIGPLITLSAVPRAWASDLTNLSDQRTLFVSRGVGMERGDAPRLRFLCRPQLVVIDLQPSLP